MTKVTFGKAERHWGDTSVEIRIDGERAGTIHKAYDGDEYYTYGDEHPALHESDLGGTLPTCVTGWPSAALPPAAALSSRQLRSFVCATAPQTALDMTWHVGERGPRTFLARQRIATALDLDRNPSPADVKWLEGVARRVQAEGA